jgi:hypothetical protein
MRIQEGIKSEFVSRYYRLLEHTCIAIAEDVDADRKQLA